MSDRRSTSGRVLGVRGSHFQAHQNLQVFLQRRWRRSGPRIDTRALDRAPWAPLRGWTVVAEQVRVTSRVPRLAVGFDSTMRKRHPQPQAVPPYRSAALLGVEVAESGWRLFLQLQAVAHLLLNTTGGSGAAQFVRHLITKAGFATVGNVHPMTVRRSSGPKENTLS